MTPTAQNADEGQENLLLQLTESLTGRSCALRIETHAEERTLSEFLRAHFQHCPVARFVEEGRMTHSSSETLQAFQDLAYSIDDSGRLGDLLNGVVFRQEGERVPLDGLPKVSRVRAGGKDVSLVDVEIDRMNVGYDRNWTGFHRRRWERHADLYEGFVADALRTDHPRDGVEAILWPDTEEGQIALLHGLARRIWRSQFENYSRFVGDKLRFKTGDETVRNIVGGRGGICAEKVQALKFLTDHYGLGSEYVIAGPNTPTPVPEAELRNLLNTFDFGFSKRFMRYWDHTALLYTFDDTTVLVDATNGNIPFLFLKNTEAEGLLGYESKRPLKVRMSVHDEDFYYHRVAQDIPENLFFAMEGWISDVDLMQVFENELGLYISKDWFVMPIAFKSAAEYDGLKGRYLQLCERAGLECDVSDGWAFDTPLGRRFSQEEADVSASIASAGDHLLGRYDDWEGNGHDGAIVTVSLRSAERARTEQC